MTAAGPDIFRLLGYIQDDLRGLQAKLVQVRTLLASLDLPGEATLPTWTCPALGCGIGKPTEQLLREHLENVHGVRDYDIQFASPPEA